MFARKISLATIIWEVFAEPEGPELQRRYVQAVTTGIAQCFDFYFPPLQKHFELNAYPSEVGLAVYFRDITTSFKKEAALRQRKANLRTATETGQLGIWYLDVNSVEIESSSFCKAIYGRSQHEEFNFADFIASVHPKDQSEIQTAFSQAISDGSIYNLEYRVVWGDGSLHWVVASGRILPNAEDGVVRMTGVSVNVTERHRAALSLMQAEKLAAVARLAASVAHDINNPLEAVTNLLYLSRQRTIEPDVQDWLDQAEQELRRVSIITSHSLRFHRQALKPEAITCLSLFSATLSALEARFRNPGIRVDKRKRANETVECSEGDVRQVHSNVIANAIDAMPNGGRLFVRSRKGTDWRPKRPGLFLTIADTGTGMSQATKSRIFEAFFTTKEIGGVGLGLWISADILARHQGTIKVRSSQCPAHTGTVITLFLPFAL